LIYLAVITKKKQVYELKRSEVLDKKVKVE
jgi:hypothetical protein